MEENFLRHEPENLSIVFTTPGQSSQETIILINDSPNPVKINYTLKTTGDIFGTINPVQTSFQFDYSSDLCPIDGLALPPHTTTSLTFSTLFPENALEGHEPNDILEGSLDLDYTGTPIPLEDCTGETVNKDNDSILKGVGDYNKLPITGSETLLVILAAITTMVIGIKMKQRKHKFRKDA